MIGLNQSSVSVFFILFFLLCYARAQDVQLYERDGKTATGLLFELHEEYLLSKSCVESKSCEAIKFIEAPDSGPAVAGPDGYALNPRTLKCKSMGGKVVILISEKLGTYDFCRFPDRSMVSVSEVTGL